MLKGHLRIKYFLLLNLCFFSLTEGSIENQEENIITHPILKKVGAGNYYDLDDVQIIQQFMQVAYVSPTALVRLHPAIDVAPKYDLCCEDETFIEICTGVDNDKLKPKVLAVHTGTYERYSYVKLKFQGGGFNNGYFEFYHVTPAVSSAQDLSGSPDDYVIARIEHTDSGYHNNSVCHLHFDVRKPDFTTHVNPLRYDGISNKIFTKGDTDSYGPINHEKDPGPFEKYEYQGEEYYKLPVADRHGGGLFVNNAIYRVEALNMVRLPIEQEGYFFEAFETDEDLPAYFHGKYLWDGSTPNINANYDLYDREQYKVQRTYFSVKSYGTYYVNVYDVSGHKVEYDVLTGLPQYNIDTNPPELGGFPSDPGYGGPLIDEHPVRSAAAVCDLDNPAGYPYSEQEIATLEEEGYLYVVNSDGSQRGRKDLTTDPGCAFKGSPAIGDVDADGAMEIVVAGPGNGGGKVYCYDVYNTYLLKKWEAALNHGTSSTPSLADINDDGYLEILIGADGGGVNAFDKDGNKLWTANVGTSVKRPVAVGDIDGDGDLEIAAIGHDYLAKVTRVKIFNHDGSVYNQGWTYNHPTADSVYKNGDIILADATDDGYLEVIYAVGPRTTDVAKIFIKKKDGDNIPNWPVIAKSDGSIMVGDYYAPGRKLVIGNNTQWNCVDGKKLTMYQINTGEPVDPKIPLVAYNIDYRSLIGNIDPDYDLEIVFPGYKYCKPHQTKNNLHGAQLVGEELPAPIEYDGSPWRVPLGEWVPGGEEPWEGQWIRNGALAEPKLADIDCDGKTEIIIPDMRSRIHAFKTKAYTGPSPWWAQWRQFQHDNLNTGCYEIFAPTGISAGDVPSDQGHAVKVIWYNSLDDGVRGIRSKKLEKCQIYRRDATVYPPPAFENVGWAPEGVYEFTDEDPSIIPLVRYHYYVKGETAAGGPGGGPRYSPNSVVVEGIPHDNIPPRRPPTSPANPLTTVRVLCISI